MTVRLTLYRHAQSASNAGQKTQWPQSIPLTAFGEKEAEALATTVPFVPRRLIGSSFLRSQQTLAPIAARFDEAQRLTWPIEEFTYLSPSACVGTSWRERRPMVEAFWERLDPDFVDGPGAESFSRLLARVSGLFDRLKGLGDDATLAVSHGQFMQAAVVMAEDENRSAGAAMARFVELEAARPFANCEPLLLTLDDGGISAWRC